MTALSPPRARRAPPSRSRPTRVSSLVFAAKVAGLRARRLVIDALVGPARLARAEADEFGEPEASLRTPLWSDERLAERAMQLGKVQNLRRASRALDGLVIPAGAVFSFWRQVGPPIATRGFARGRMLQQGCMVPAVGGGLCQLSNALYDAALQAGCAVLERHAHSRIVPGSAAAEGRDATVAWNYVDLRFAPDRDLRLTARLDRDSLIVGLSGRTGDRPAPAPVDAPTARSAASAARSCASCSETDCFLHEGGRGVTAAGRRVFLVDEAWPEFRDFVRLASAPGDRLGRPLDGARLGLERYAWPREGFDAVRGAPVAALGRALAQRRAGDHGPARRAAEAAGAGRIAQALAGLLTPDAAAVTVAQSYLPYLWREGLLGGREVSVLMTRLPMGVLQARLDAAAAAHPERASLADFRAPAWLVRAEAEALAEAARIVTPHAEIAALFGARAIRLGWDAPPARPAGTGPIRRIAFPGPTLARKGAHAVRAAALALDLEVVVLGAELEGPGFWRGVRAVGSDDGRGVDAVVQPALVEGQPRRLLAALAAGVRVVASAACGLDPRPGLTLVAHDDAAALIAALRA